MKPLILLLLMAVTATAQTNAPLVSTNDPAKKKPAVHAVTLAEVQAGLTTISNQIASLQAKSTAARKQHQEALKNLDLQLKAGKISHGQAAEISQKMRFNPPYLEMDRGIASLQLQEATIRQRYKYLLSP